MRNGKIGRMTSGRQAISLWVLLGLLTVSSWAQQGGNNVLEVTERTEEGEAVRVDIDFVNLEMQQLMRFLSRETGLTIIATEQDIRDKRLSLTNLRNVTIPEALDAINTGLQQFGLTMVRTDNMIIITTLQKAIRMQGPVTYGADPEGIPETAEIRTHVLPLNYLEASQLAERVRPLLSEQAVVFADETANALVITDAAANIRRIATLIQPMDAEPESPLRVKVIQLRNTSVQEVQDALDDLFSAQTEAARLARRAGRSRDPERFKRMLEQASTLGVDLATGIIEIEANTETNQLIVLASEENIQIIEKLVEQMDVPAAVQTEFRVFRLRYADAEETAQNLQEVLQGATGGGRQRERERWRPWWEQQQQQGGQIQGIVGEVRVSADTRMNALIVASDPRNWSLLESLINELDQPDQPENEIEIFFLKNADATTIVQQINELVQGQQQGQQNRPWWWEPPREQEQREGVYGLRGQVNLTADTRLNAVIAATSSSNLEVLRDLIARLDVSMPEQEWGTRIYQLRYADAENIANILNSVYQGQSQQGGGFGFFSFLPSLRQRNQARGSLAGNVVAEAYPTLNAVIISTSTARNFELIEQFIRELDVPTPPEQREVTTVINLEYSDAEQLANLLNDLWQQQQGGFGGGGFFQAVLRGFRPEQNDINSLVGKVRVNYDSQTNSLIVTTRSRYIEDVRRIVEQLDIVRGQVQIDVTILEVTLDDSTKLGMELQLTENRLFGVDAFGKGRAPGSNPLSGTFESDVNLGDEITGFTLTMATKEYLAFLHTMMRENKVRTLSRVPLFVRDNNTAVFTSGRDIPYLQSAQTSTFLEGQIFNFAFLQDIGINIQITPHISRRRTQEGKKPTIGLQIDQITASNFIEFTSFNAPVTEESTIQTYIDAEDGQTIVIGGLKKRKQQNIVEKVPILGDVPILGALFRRTEKVTQESEIVIVIQPHIIDISRQSETGYRIEELPSQREMKQSVEQAQEAIMKDPQAPKQ
ncbi:MAG: hypothetical protein KatS3mg115_1534 [Candidatus Poribacteria bacterium]|nr:MAG: hypothetical protein KatS3mg115_1534 [Candidatus Poribacteria bacterium]